jgi:hypothetical protein
MALASSIDDFAQGCVHFLTTHLSRETFRDIQRHCVRQSERAIIFVQIDGHSAWKQGEVSDVALLCISSEKRNLLRVPEPLTNEVEHLLRTYDPQTELAWIFTTTGELTPGDTHKTVVARSEAPAAVQN